AVRIVKQATGSGRFYRGAWQRSAVAAPPDADAAWGYRRDRFVLEDYLAATYRIPTIFHSDFLSMAPRRTALLERDLAGAPWDERLPFLSAAAVTTVLASPGLRLPQLEPLTA